jgi:N6-L-threonylcarbamoyladenine synthase
MPFLTLGIETSCDETAASVVADGWDIRSSIVASQFVHSKFGGVVPELASRAHIRLIVPIVQTALEVAKVGLRDLNLIAATNTPGLLGALLVGLPFAKSLAWANRVPFVGVNHLEGHLFATFLQNPEMPVPFVCLVVSGGHTELILVEEKCRYRLLGATLDDACGEAFDKAAKMLGLPYPGGMFIEEHARQGRRAVKFPNPQVAGLDFSFSGLKTSLLYYLRDHKEFSLADVCHSFQETLVEALVTKVARAAEETGIKRIAVTGGVAVNLRLRLRMQELAETRALEVLFPDRSLCTDNAAMIAACGYARFQRFGASPLSLPAFARQALDAVSMPA